MNDFSQSTDTRSNESESWPVSDTISILVATDNHLGCFEKDPIRGNDSMATFEEILKIATAEKVCFNDSSILTFRWIWCCWGAIFSTKTSPAATRSIKPWRS